MIVNGADLTSLFEGKVKQFKIEMGARSMSNNSDWVPGVPTPMLTRTSGGFKDLTVVLQVFGNGRADIQGRMNEVITMLMEPIEMGLDHWDRKFSGYLISAAPKEFSYNTRESWQNLELKFKGYEHGDRVSVSVENTDMFTVYNPGNMVSPAIVELTPVIGKNTFTVSGICRDSVSGDDLEVVLNDITTGNKIMLDGITGMLTETKSGEVKLANVEIWALPSLLPGNNTIKLETNRMKVTVTVLPIYM